MDYKITREARVKLARPWGNLFTGEPDQAVPKLLSWIEENEPESGLYCVGDVVSKSALSNDGLRRILRIAIVDGITQRGEDVDLEDAQYNIRRIKNPAGVISDEATTAIEELVNESGTTVIEVDGEEDLLVLPLCRCLPDDELIIYGQPPHTDADQEIPAGIVIIRVDDYVRERVAAIFEQFEPID